MLPYAQLSRKDRHDTSIVLTHRLIDYQSYWLLQETMHFLTSFSDVTWVSFNSTAIYTESIWYFSIQ